MLKTAARATQTSQAARPLHVEIMGVATAVPQHKVCQDDVAERAKKVFPHLARLGALYGNTGIETRYSCQPSDWYYQRHGWEARTEVFQHHALALLEEVAHASVAAAGISLDIYVIARMVLASAALSARTAPEECPKTNAGPPASSIRASRSSISRSTV